MDALKSDPTLMEKERWYTMGSDKAEDVLKGTTLEIYRYLLKKGKPQGTREVQRALNSSSPSLAVYHLAKLEDAGLLKRENGDYVVDRVILEDTIKISRYFVPRYLFYAIFAVVGLGVDLAFFRPVVLTSGYFFASVVIAVCAVGFCFETVRAQLRGKLKIRNGYGESFLPHFGQNWASPPTALPHCGQYLVDA